MGFIMAILTSFETINWKITFSEDNENLMANLLQVTGNMVTSLSATGITRDAVLQNPTNNLVITDTGVSGVTVVSVENADLADYLNEIRWLLNAALTENDLSDQQIRSPFLRSAEFEVYDALGVTEAEYDTRSATDMVFREKVRLSTLYRTAALLVPSIPDILQQRIFEGSVRYVEYDPKEKIANFIRLSNNEIEEFIPTENQRTGFAAGSFQRRFIGF